jgi:hypothetical protein
MAESTPRRFQIIYVRLVSFSFFLASLPPIFSFFLPFPLCFSVLRNILVGAYPAIELIRKEHRREAHSPTMTAFNAFGKSLSDAVTLVCTADRDWTKWVCLNHDIDALPAEISLYKDHPERDWDNEQTLESGRYKDLEWACEPDWFRVDRWWQGWIPTGGGADFNPWYLDLDTLLPYVTIENRFALAEDTRKMMKSSIEELQMSVDALILVHYLNCDLPAPPRYDDSILDGTFQTLRDLRIKSTNAKRAALTRAGWILWWTKIIPDSYPVTPACIQDLLHFGLGDAYIYRGHIIDLCWDWQAFDIALFLYHRIPVFYSWGFDERNDERFSHLHPRLLVLLEDGQLLGPTAGLNLNDELTESAAASWKYDDYLMNIYANAPSGLSTYDSGSLFMVIDFEGWGRRPIGTDLAPSYASKFHFTTSTAEVTGDPIVIFWRWRPREVPTIKERLEREETRSQAFDRQSALWSIRAIFAHALAPTATRKFNIVTGTPLRDNSSSLEQRLAEHAWDTSSCAEDDDMRSITTNDEAEERNTRPLRERIGRQEGYRCERAAPVRPSLMNLTTWKNFSDKPVCNVLALQPVVTH